MSYRNLAFAVLMMLTSLVKAAPCNGHFINPITDICWSCLFPLSFGHMPVVKGKLPDTENPKSVISTCPSDTGVRIGFNLGYWEPFAIADVTDTPYCMVNLGGLKLNLGKKQQQGGRKALGYGQTAGFFHVHWYKYPLMAWLNIVGSASCLEKGDFDVAYLSELDPTWQDSEMAFLLNPEVVLFGNPVAQAACAKDSIDATVFKTPSNSLFWCAGSQGSIYPLAGHVNAPISPMQTAFLLTQRMNYKLHREHLISDSSPAKGAICKQHFYPVTPKNRYRYSLVNQVADGKRCVVGGMSTLLWEEGKIKIHKPNQYGFLVWRKRNCAVSLI